MALPALELRPLGRLARSQSLYRLPYRGSCLAVVPTEIIFLEAVTVIFTRTN
jgi:hypothetical protein